MMKNFDEIKDEYDAIVVGSGLGGLTAAKRLGKAGYSVLLLEQHFLFGGLATYFRRKGHIFDVSLHGFPVGMKKTLRKYWTKELADRIVQLDGIRFDNPQFSLETTFDTENFKQILEEKFDISRERSDAFYDYLAKMNYYDENTMTNRELFEKFFPGRNDVWRLLMEPMTYANGSTLDEPAISYGIVFSNFMSKGVFTFDGGTDLMLDLMIEDLGNNNVDCVHSALVDKVLVEDGKVTGVQVKGKTVKSRIVISNAGIVNTINKLVGPEHFKPEFLSSMNKVRLNTSSSQVYIGIKKGEKIDFCGDLLFTSTHPEYSPEAILNKDCTSRTFSFYYPKTRPDAEPDYTIVASMNSKYEDWKDLSDEEYKAAKEQMIQESLDVLEKYVPGIRDKVDYLEAATPVTFKRYTLHGKGSAFGTKFEGLDTSMHLAEQVEGLYHTGSVGIIMSGWLGAANYGAITATNVDKFLCGF